MFFQLTLPGLTKPIPEPSGFKFTGGTLADVLNAALKYIFPAAGLILFVVLILGGFQLLVSAGNPEQTSVGYKKILFAIIGFLVIFIAYWLMQILEYTLGIKVF